MKAEVGFMEYTPEERVAIARQAQSLFDIFVNRDNKMALYGYEVDPIPTVSDVVSRAATMSDHDFHMTMHSIFTRLNDHHTRYEFPAPHRCFTTVSPISFALIDSTKPLDNPQVVVRSITRRPEIVSVLSPKEKAMLEKVQPGDLLVLYNGSTFKDFVEANGGCGGATAYSKLAVCASYISLRRGLYQMLHDRFEDVYVLRRGRREYVVKVPIAATRNDRCIASQERATAMNFNTEPEVEPSCIQCQIMGVNGDFFRRLYGGPKFGFGLRTTREPTVNWAILQSKIGILRIDSFSPVQMDVDQTGRLIRRLLLNELKDTLGLIIDVRDNGGGSINLAAVMPQFFSSRQVESLRFRALISEINRRYFAEAPDFGGGPWQQAFDSAGPADRYTDLVSLYTDNELNSFGQAYLKPVAIFNNARCYSACELLSAVFQDHGIGLVFGEEPHTGGGGANVVDIKDVLKSALPDVFQGLPGGQNMHVSWRQVVRMGGSNDGNLVEDMGVSADHIVRPSAKDFQENSNYEPLLRVAAQLLESGVQSGQSFASCTVSWLTRLELYHDNKLVQSLEFPAGRREPSKFTLAFPEPLTRLGIVAFTIKGYVGNNQALETKRYVRITPHISDYLNVASGTTWTWDFGFSHEGDDRNNSKDSQIRKYVGIYNSVTDPKDGWHVSTDTRNSNGVGKQLVLGDNNQYHGIVFSKVSFFLDIAPGAKPKLVLKGNYNLRSKADRLSIRVSTLTTPLFNQEKEYFEVMGSGGKQPVVGDLSDVVMDLMEFAGKQVSVVIAFEGGSGTRSIDREVSIYEVAVVA
ncbi:hypothetical protein HK102_012434 [Quaeritorhiza haematococci]|nr:hypothetical protein HK102_012434 [Quaeritorhiza haematococci]